MAVHSMTGYGNAEVTTDNGNFYCEARSLNSRYLEVFLRLPKGLHALEQEINNIVKSRLHRGKVDISIELRPSESTATLPAMNASVVRHYVKLYEQLQKELEQSVVANFASLQDLNPLEILKLDGVLQPPAKLRGKDFADALLPDIRALLTQTLDALIAAREQEGIELQKAMQELLDELTHENTQIRNQRDQILQELSEQTHKRVENIVKKFLEPQARVTISEDRLLTEVAILSDKMDIDEELTRLQVHIENFKTILTTMTSKESCGRKLDFICQEMHREVNTMSNKLVQVQASKHTLQMKQLIERLRQQVQNIE